jgi:DNA-binding transcriptional ArsR family regulator
MLGGMTTRDPRAPLLARLAGLIADETRAACLLALLDGRAWTASELARHAGVAASTLSEHLGKLVAGGVLAEERQGRHRYVRLADARVAQLVEDLAAQVAPDDVVRPRTLRASSAGSAMARGRTCFALTDAGLRWYEGAGIALDRKGRRPLARACLDWTERRPHLAGVAGAALCRHALDAGWCVRIGSERAVKVTATGERALAELLGIEPTALR